MKHGRGIPIFLGKTEVDHVDLVSTLIGAHQEVIWLDVAVDVRPRVNMLDASEELIDKQKDCLQRELSMAKVEKILQARSKGIQDYGVVFTLDSMPVNTGDSNTR